MYPTPTANDDPAKPRKKAAASKPSYESVLGVSTAAAATRIIREVKTSRPPNRSVSIPAGMRASDPSSTGTTTSNAACVLERWYVCRKIGPNAPTNPHMAKHNANEIVLRLRCRVMNHQYRP